MSISKKTITRRDFIKGAGGAAIGLTLGMPAFAEDTLKQKIKTKVVLVRHRDVIAEDGAVNGTVIGDMLDQAMIELFGKKDPLECWKQILKPDDIVGIKSNGWPNLPTPRELEDALKARVMRVGISGKNVAVDDRGVLKNPVFTESTALINVRPMRTHAWAGAGSLIKNYIMFVPKPYLYHDDSCADLGAIWHLPMVEGKTRLNILVLLTPLFYGVGPHHFDTTYVWPYRGLLLGTDPVAVDTIGLRLFQAKRREYFGEERPIRPSAHHIAMADMRYKLGTSDLAKIELVKLGWSEGVLI
jgi:hypothetical protein